MIPHGASLHIKRIALCNLVVLDTTECYPEKFTIYLHLLQENPWQDVDPLVVKPLVDRKGIYVITNGRHRFCASIMAGRSDVLCIIVQQGESCDTT